MDLIDENIQLIQTMIFCQFIIQIMLTMIDNVLLQ